MTKGIYMNTEYLEKFFRNLLLGETNELKNRYVHIRAQNLPVNKTQRLLLELLLENSKLTYDELADLKTNKMTIEEKAKLIIKDIKNEKDNDPCQIFRNIVKNDYINMHDPEHHILDGACILMAFYNAGGKIDIDSALEKILMV